MRGDRRWKPIRTTSRFGARTRNAGAKPRGSFFATRKTTSSVRRSAGVNSRKKRKPISKRARTARRTPFPGRLDRRSYITQDNRVRLFGKDMTILREQVFERSGGTCEAKLHHPECPRRIGWSQGELAHKKHGSRKTDTLEGTEFRSPVCHQIMQHSGFKPQGVE